MTGLSDRQIVMKVGFLLIKYARESTELTLNCPVKRIRAQFSQHAQIITTLIKLANKQDRAGAKNSKIK